MVLIIVGLIGIALVVLLVKGFVQLSKESDIKSKELDEQYGELTKEFDIGWFGIDDTIRIYADSKKIWLMGKVYDFKDIRSVSLETETKAGRRKVIATSSTDTLGTIGRSIAGAVVGGSTGALIGAGTAKHKTVIEQEVENDTIVYIVDIKTTDMQKPVVTVRLEAQRDKAIELYSTFELILEQTK